MRIFTVISTLALVLVPTTDAQLPNVPKRLRADDENKEPGHHERQSSQQQRKMMWGGDRIRSFDRPVMSMPLVPSAMSMPLEPSDFHMSMPFDMMVKPTEPTNTEEDPCAVLTKKRCRKDDTCTWDNLVCYTTPTINFLRGARIRTFHMPAMSMPLESSAMSMPLEPAEFQMSMPFAMMVAPTGPTTTEDPCAELTKKRCRKDDKCTWDDPVCHTTPTAKFLGRQKMRDGDLIRTIDKHHMFVPLESSAMSMPLEPAEFQMSMPFAMMVAPTGPTTTEDPCAKLIKKRCKRSKTCTWDDPVCHKTLAEVAAIEVDSKTPTKFPSSVVLTPFPTDGPRDTPFPTDGPREVATSPGDGDRNLTLGEEEKSEGPYIEKEYYSVELLDDLHSSARSLVAPTTALALVYTAIICLM